MQTLARSLGALPQSGIRAGLTARSLVGILDDVLFLAPPGDLGVRWLPRGARVRELDVPVGDRSTARETMLAARASSVAGADLLLFAGGDGTARDIYEAVGTGQVCLGVPTGVKIQSPVFATHPRTAALVCARYLADPTRRTQLVEVVDLDENELRTGRVQPRVHGALLVPADDRGLQGGKESSPSSERDAIGSIAGEVVARMDPEVLYLLGPGTTTSAVSAALGVESTLIGVDAVRGGSVVGLDLGTPEILPLVRRYRSGVIVSPTGGQGFLLGRGNQQLGAEVLRLIDADDLMIVATPSKLARLEGRPMLVDTGDNQIDLRIAGYRRVVTGWNQQAVYPVAVASG